MHPHPETAVSDDDRKTLDFDFFRSLARELTGDVAVAIASGAAPTKEVEQRVAEALRDSFESGLSSSLVAVVSAIEAVRVPPNGMVLFRFPDTLPEHGVSALRRDLKAISDLLAKRLGHNPIILTLPDSIEAQVVEFEGVDGPADFLGPQDEVQDDELLLKLAPGQRRIVALDHLKLLSLIRGAVRSVFGIPAEDPVEAVQVFPTGCAVTEGVATHDLRITMPPTVDFGRIEDAAGRAVRGVLADFAKETGARYNVTVVPDGAVALRPVTFTVEP